MSSLKTIARLPRGFQDRGTNDIVATQDLIAKIAHIYKLYGFEPLETPFFEYTETLGKFLPDTDRPNAGVFSVQDDDEQWMSLRYDLTAPLARYVAQNFDTLPKPYRSSRHGYVFRNEKPGPGRFRQFMQCDADIVGTSSVAADAEICMMAADCMEAAGIKRGDYVIKVNNRKILDGVMEAIGLGGDEHAERRLIVLRAIDKLDRLGVEGVRLLLGAGRKDESGDFTKGAGLTQHQIDKILVLFAIDDMAAHSRANNPTFVAGVENGIIDKRKAEHIRFMGISGGLGENIRGSTLGTAGYAELTEMWNLIKSAGYDDGRIRIDPSVVRGLEYYTGPVFEAELTFEVKDEKGQAIRFGSVGGGGRYDGLIARFRNEPVPATGFSVGISRLQAALSALNSNTAKKPYGPVVILAMDKETASLSAYQKMVAQFRVHNIPAEVYYGQAGMNAQLKYADKRNAIVAIIQGSNERENGKVIVKDLIAGAELASAAKTLGREAYLALKEKSQLIVNENDFLSAVKDVLGRYKF